MTKSAKVDLILATLETLYPTPSIPLRHQDPYTLLVAVVLSAQSTDARVNQVTPGLFARARTPEQMAGLPVETIQTLIRPCGLAPQKARAIRELSRLIAERHQGQVPRTLEELEALPGVGHKTAQVVLAQAFGEATFPVDTHIHRLAWRWGLSSGKNVAQTEKDLKRLFPEERWNHLHLQIIYFGREHCPARGHDPHRCPLCSVVGRREIFGDR
ncbi:MAG: endonuclease III [Candidatus Latescibacteria bacterium]|nr:endonuclease III [Candidatus Latescibacterota bacterium]